MQSVAQQAQLSFTLKTLKTFQRARNLSVTEAWYPAEAMIEVGLLDELFELLEARDGNSVKSIGYATSILCVVDCMDPHGVFGTFLTPARKSRLYELCADGYAGRIQDNAKNLLSRHDHVEFQARFPDVTQAIGDIAV